jgi:hypothetical protein
MKKNNWPPLEGDIPGHQEPANSGYLNEVMEKFRSRFAPCSDIALATNLLSTHEVHSALNRHNPGSNVTVEQVYTLLISEGYTWQVDDSRFTFDLKWMLKQV